MTGDHPVETTLTTGVAVQINNAKSYAPVVNLYKR